MRNWVKKYLLSQTDDRISREEYLREIVVPSFALRRLAGYFQINFSANTRLVELFGGVISDLPEEVFLQLLSTRNLFFFFTDALAFVQSLNFVEGKQGILCAFSKKLLELSDSIVRGGIVHELGHIVSGHYNAEVQSSRMKADLENEADGKAIEWGFEFEILAIRKYLKSKPSI